MTLRKVEVPMSTSQISRLRTFVIVLLGLLFVQYILGMLVNFADPASLPAFSLSDSNAFNAALQAVGWLAEIHSVLGFLVWLLAVVNLVLSLRSPLRRVQVFAALALLSVTLAGVGGTLFVASGFNNDDFSSTMAGNFLFSYTFLFLELYFLRGIGQPQPAASR